MPTCEVRARIARLISGPSAPAMAISVTSTSGRLAVLTQRLIATAPMSVVQITSKPASSRSINVFITVSAYGSLSTIPIRMVMAGPFLRFYHYPKCTMPGKLSLRL